MAVRAGLGVSLPTHSTKPWLDLFDGGGNRYMSFHARELTVRWMAACLPALEKHNFHANTRYKNFWLGRTFFDIALHRMFAVIAFSMLLDAVCRKHGIDQLSTWRMDELPRDIRDALSILAKSRGLPLNSITAPAPLAYEGPSAPLFGHHEYFGSLGAEVASIRPGVQHGFSGPANQHGFSDFNRQRLPVTVSIGDKAESVALVVRLLYAYSDRDHPIITLATRTRECTLTIERDGVYDRTVEPAIRLTGPPGPGELSFIATIAHTKAWFGLVGEPMVPVRVKRRSQAVESLKAHLSKKYAQRARIRAPGVHIDCPASEGPLLRFGEMTVLTDLNDSTHTERQRGLAHTITDLSPNNGLVSSKAPSSAPVIGTFMAARSQAIASWPGLGREMMPIHFHGLESGLAKAGLTSRLFYFDASWHLGARQTPKIEDGIVLDALSLPETTEAEINEGAARITAALADICAAADLPNLPAEAGSISDIDFRPLLRSALMESGNDAKWHCEQYERCRLALGAFPVAAVIGPRLDSGYLSAAAAASSLGVKTGSLEISFLFHEHQRLHRLVGIPETTDAIVYWGRLAVQRLKELGLPADDRQVSGFHSLDYFALLRCVRETLKDKAAYWGTLGVPDVEGPVVLMGTHYGGRHAMVDIDYYRNTIRAALDGLNSAGCGMLVVKTLTTDDPNTISDILGSLDQRRLRLLSPYHAFQNAHFFVGSDLVIAGPTTLLAEAAAMGVPAYVLDYGNTDNWYPASKRHMMLLNSISPRLKSLSEVEEMVSRLGHGEPVRHKPDEDAMRDLFGKGDGGNLEQAIRAMRDLGLEIDAN
jgi:hypothetical protein